MDQPPKKSAWPRHLRRTALVFGLFVAVGASWVLFFPVSLGGAARWGLGRAFPADGALQLTLDAVTFRWRWGQPAVAIEVQRLNVSARGRPLLTVNAIVVEVSKAGLWSRHFAPSLVTVTAPQFTLDQTPSGALALVAPPSAAIAAIAATPPPATTVPSPAPGGPLEFRPLARVLPLRGETSKLVIENFVVQLRNAVGDVNVPFGRIETMLAQTATGNLELNLTLPLIAGTSPAQLTAHAAFDVKTGRVEFAVKLPPFATADLPVVPGTPPLPLRATVALDATGHFALATGQLEDIAGGLSVARGEFTLPGPGGAKLPVDAIELRGRADLKNQRLVLETARAQLGSLAIAVSEFETTLGPTMQSRWQIEITGPTGGAVLPLLPAAVLAQLPLPAEGIESLAIGRVVSRGQASFSHVASGAWTSNALQSDARVELSLGRETLVATVEARQLANAPTIAVDVTVPPFVPARWPVALIAGTPAGAIDLPLELSAHATLTAAGAPRTARVALTAAPGTLRPLQPGLPPLAVQRFEIRAESEQFDRAWRIPVARLDLANGATAELADAQVDLAPRQFAAQGEIRATGFSGEFAALWFPADVWAPLIAAGLTPRDVALDRLRIGFKAAARQNNSAWKPFALAAAVETQLRLHAVPLNLTAKISLPDGGTQMDATIDLAEFRPTQLGLTLSDGLTTAAFDFPVSLHATARASTQGELSEADAQLRIGVGRIKTPAALGDLDLPVKSIVLDAGFDATHARATVKSLRLDAAGIRLNVRDVTATLATLNVIAGQLALEPFALNPALALWPVSQQPELRRQILSTLRAGEFLGAELAWNVAYNSTAKTSVQIAKIAGSARLGKIELLPAGVPGSVTLGNLTATVDYPRATVDLENVVLPGAQLSSARAQIAALDSVTPNASVTAKFETDLVAANRAWQFAPPNALGGRASGELYVSAPFSAETIEARLTLDLARTTCPLPGFSNAAPDGLALTARIEHGLSATVAPTVDLTLTADHWLGTPLRIAARTILSPGNYRPSVVDLTHYEHGRTRLQGKFAQPSATRREISLTGTYLDLVPLLRFGLAAADGFAAPTAPASAPVAATPVPAAHVTPPPIAAIATVAVDVHVDQIEFGPNQTARDLELHTQLENNWPTRLTVQAQSGGANALRVELAGPANRQTLKLTIGSVADWMRTLTAPWAATPPSSGPFGSLVAQLMKVPTIVSGGAVSADAELRRDEPEWFRGRLHLSRATMVRPPRILQILAFKSGRSLQLTPLIQDFTMGQIVLSLTELHVADIALTGSGLIGNLKIKSAGYGLQDEKLNVDGQYFGVPFEVTGTRANPQVYLKDNNLLIRAVGVKDEGFFNDESTPAPKPGK